MAPPQETDDPILANSNTASTEDTQISETPAANPPGTETGGDTSARTSTITSTTIETTTTRTPRKKPGPPLKPHTERAPRAYRRDRPIVRPIKTYSRGRCGCCSS